MALRPAGREASVVSTSMHADAQPIYIPLAAMSNPGPNRSGSALLRYDPNSPAAILTHNPSTAALKKNARIDCASAVRRASFEQTVTSEV